MGQVGRWIDARCAEEPQVMRRVLNRKFGDLRDFVEGEGKCGCLVGSWALERRKPGEYFIELDNESRHIGHAVAHLTLWRQSWSRAPKRPDAFVIRLVKQRIRKALGINSLAGVTETCAAVSA